MLWRLSYTFIHLKSFCYRCLYLYIFLYYSCSKLHFSLFIYCVSLAASCFTKVKPFTFHRDILYVKHKIDKLTLNWNRFFHLILCMMANFPQLWIISSNKWYERFRCFWGLSYCCAHRAGELFHSGCNESLHAAVLWIYLLAAGDMHLYVNLCLYMREVEKRSMLFMYYRIYVHRVFHVFNEDCSI